MGAYGSPELGPYRNEEKHTKKKSNILNNIFSLILILITLTILSITSKNYTASLRNVGVNNKITDNNNLISDKGLINTIVSLDINDIITGMEENPIKIKQEYEAIAIKTTGKILKIGYTDKEAYIFLIGDSTEYGDLIQCTFNDDQYERLAELSKNDIISVTGIGYVTQDRFCLIGCRLNRLDIEDTEDLTN